MAQLDRSAQNIIASALDTNEFFRISKCKTTKEMWETLKASHEPNDSAIQLAKTASKSYRPEKQSVVS